MSDAVVDAYRRLESEGVIEGYSAIINPAKVGLTVQALVQVKLAADPDEAVATFEHAVAAIDEVINCFATTGAFDFTLQVQAADLESLSTVVLRKLLRIAVVRDLQSSVVLATTKPSLRVPLGQIAT